MAALARTAPEPDYVNGRHPRRGRCYGDQPHDHAGDDGVLAGPVNAHAHEEDGCQETVQAHDGEEDDGGVEADDVKN